MATSDAALEDVVDRRTLDVLRLVVPAESLEIVKVALKLAYLKGAQQAGSELARNFDEAMAKVQGRLA